MRRAMDLPKIAAIAVLALAAIVSAQNQPQSAGANRATAARSMKVGPRSLEIERQMQHMQTPTATNERLKAMQDTLTKMHAVLKQMQADAAESKATFPLAQANVDMWELMLGQLDREFDELRVATLSREDLEARRAAMYQQAMARTAVAGRGARNMSSSQALAAGRVRQGVTSAAGHGTATPK